MSDMSTVFLAIQLLCTEPGEKKGEDRWKVASGPGVEIKYYNDLLKMLGSLACRCN